jgi:Na+/proline symporter
MGGMTTVIWTDVMQFFLFIGSGFLALIWMVAMLPEGWTQFLTQAARRVNSRSSAGCHRRVRKRHSSRG